MFRYCLITHLEELRVFRRPLASGHHYVLSRYTYGVFTHKRDTACLYAPTLHRTPTDDPKQEAGGTPATLPDA